MLYFSTRRNVFQGELASSEEGKVWWVPLYELPNMSLSDGMETMLRLFCEEELSEQFFFKEW